MSKKVLIIIMVTVSLGLVGCWEKLSPEASWSLSETKRQVEAEMRCLPEKTKLIMRYLAGIKSENGMWVYGKEYESRNLKFERVSLDLEKSNLETIIFVKYNGNLVFQLGLDFSGGVYVENYTPGKLWENELDKLSKKAKQIEESES